MAFYHEKIKFISSSCRVIFSFYRMFCKSNSVKAGNDAIDILTSEDNSEDMENTPRESRM